MSPDVPQCPRCLSLSRGAQTPCWCCNCFIAFLLFHHQQHFQMLLYSYIHSSDLCHEFQASIQVFYVWCSSWFLAVQSTRQTLEMQQCYACSPCCFYQCFFQLWWSNRWTHILSQKDNTGPDLKVEQTGRRGVVCWRKLGTWTLDKQPQGTLGPPCVDWADHCGLD